MTESWTRAAAAEWLHWSELDYIDGVSPGLRVPTPNSYGVGDNRVKSGAKSFRLSSIISAYGWTGLGGSIRAGYWLRHEGASSTWAPFRIYMLNGAGTAYDDALNIYVTVNKGIELQVSTSLSGGIPVPVTIATKGQAQYGLHRTNRWMHFGLDFTATSQRFWIDGQLVFDESAIFVGSPDALSMAGSFGSGWWGAYMDNPWCYSGSLGATPPEAKLFFPGRVNADQGTNNFTPLAGPNNYDEVYEDTAPDDDTTYIESNVNVGGELYDHDAAGVPTMPAWDFGTVYIIAKAKIVDDGGSHYLPVNFYAKSGANLASYDVVIGASSVIGDWANVFDNMTVQPGGAAWTETFFDSSEFGFITAVEVAY